MWSYHLMVQYAQLLVEEGRVWRQQWKLYQQELLTVVAVQATCSRGEKGHPKQYAGVLEHTVIQHTGS